MSADRKRSAGDLNKQEADHAYALSLIQVHEQKIRVLLNSKARRSLKLSLSMLGRVFPGKLPSLQTFDQYIKLARHRARNLAAGRAGSIPTEAAMLLPGGPSVQPHDLAASVQDSPVYAYLLERAGGAARASCFAIEVGEAAEKAVHRRRPGLPRNVVVSIPGAVEDFGFRARMLGSPQHDLLLRQRPMVSVIVPTHNRSGLLQEAIRSVLQQTYPHLELLIVDDHSSDDTKAVCERHLSDPRVRYLRNEGRGVAAARNTGIRNSGGSYIAYLDDDNRWGADYIEIILTHLLVERSDFAYSSMRLTDHNGIVRYRGRHFNHADLLVQNYIDMNVVIHRREVLDGAGLFDESLERTVDWEFIIRATKTGRVSWAEFIGVDYSDDATRADRLTVAKRYAWRFHVMNRHLVDWAGSEAAAEGDAISATVLINGHGNAAAVESTLAEILRNTPEGGWEVIVVDNRLNDEDVARLWLWSELLPSLRIVHAPQYVGLGLGLNIGAQFARGRILALVGLGVKLPPNWLAPLARELDDDPDLGAVQPILTLDDGRVFSAGFGWVGVGSDLPERLRSEPFGGGGGSKQITAASVQCLAMRRADFVALHGFEPLFTENLMEVDFSFRLRTALRKACAVLPSMVVTYAPQARRVEDQPPDSVSFFRRIWGERIPGFQAEDVGKARSDRAGRVAANGRAPAERSGAERLRFAIKICCPSEAVKLQWGDYHFANSLAKELVKLGHQCRIDMNPDWYQEGRQDDVVLVLRGLYRFTPVPNAVNLLWLISHPGRVQLDELSGFDHVFVASDLFARQLGERADVPVTPMLQCTDTGIFHPAPAPPEDGRIVFVGNSRKAHRPVVAAASAEGIPLDIYGGGWEGLCRPEMVMADSITNEEVGRLYRSAALVLNDHWEDMREHGFVSNRLFDACACAAPVISDRVPGLEVFDGLVEVLEPGQALTPLVAKVLQEAPGLRARRLDLAARIAAQHSFAARAGQIVEKSRALMLMS